MICVVVQAEGQQHRLLQPLVGGPDAVDPRAATRGLAGVQQVQGLLDGVADRRRGSRARASSRSSQAASMSASRSASDGRSCGGLLRGGRWRGRAPRAAARWSTKGPASVAACGADQHGGHAEGRGRLQVARRVLEEGGGVGVDAVAARSCGRRCAGRAWGSGRRPRCGRRRRTGRSMPSLSSTRSAWAARAVGEDQPAARQALQRRRAGRGRAPGSPAARRGPRRGSRSGRRRGGPSGRPGWCRARADSPSAARRPRRRAGRDGAHDIVGHPLARSAA